MFVFSIDAAQLRHGDALSLAVGYAVEGSEYWDSNRGENYTGRLKVRRFYRDFPPFFPFLPFPPYYRCISI